ncbi:two-component system response regulator AtoC [Silvibacterium bohemicum]|uniref:Two-component system response regulator AtoC n=1 Tax=Silvibacterium bohemicum TaxID=1577686 RepID=A0A841JSZ8_9BACT|nr:sigma-54 dependent transcriptional regulator [Silvibacterium bohemicum]MBB6142889.1 two-component system response regulator AtoC [Silvibacterium bohemicum]
MALIGSQYVIGNTIETARLLAVSRDSAVLRPLWLMGESNHWQFESVPNAWDAMERVQSGASPDLLLLDLPRGDADGLHILRWLRRLRPALPIILICHPDDVGKEQEALRLGAREYLVTPVDGLQLETAIRHYLSTGCEAVETDIASDDIELISDDIFFIGISPIMRKIRAQAALLAESNVPVLILGESGSGKDTIARLLHKLSVRSGFEFAKVNCAALPGDLLERELFGYEREDAAAPVRTKLGKLECCVKGTVLLDEITEMPMSVQASLLQVLQSQRYIRPGTTAAVEVDVRVLATSTINMEHAISKNRLRVDLYHRLSAYTIHVPSLRERKEELPLLSRHFMHQFAKHYGLSPRDFSPAFTEACQAYSWPGNLRELASVVKRYLMVGDKELSFEPSRQEEATQDAVSTSPRRVNSPASSLIQSRGGATGSDSLKSLVQSVKLEAERNVIAEALEKTGWNRKAAARLLKVSYRTLLYKIEQYQMKSTDSSSFPSPNGSRGKRTGFRDGRVD